MISRRRVSVLLVSAAVLTAVAGGAWGSARSAAPLDAPQLPVTSSGRLAAFTEEAIHPYADGRGLSQSLRRLLARLGRGEAITAAMSAVYGLSQAEVEHLWRRVLGG